MWLIRGFLWLIRGSDAATIEWRRTNESSVDGHLWSATSLGRKHLIIVRLEVPCRTLTKLADFPEQGEYTSHRHGDPLSEVPRCNDGASEDEVT